MKCKKLLFVQQLYNTQNNEIQPQLVSIDSETKGCYGKQHVCVAMVKVYT